VCGRASILALLGLLAAPSAWAADPSISVDAKVEPSALGPGETGRLDLTIDVPEGWHLWSLDPGEGPQPLELSIEEGAPGTLVGDWHGDTPVMVYDRGFEGDRAQYKEGKVALSRHFQVANDAASGEASTHVLIDGQICNEGRCIPQNKRVPLAFTVADFATGAAAPTLTGGKLTVAAMVVRAPPSEPAKVATQQPKKASPGEGGLLAFLLAAFGFGLAALATPCVFPAIPLTISFFSKYSEENFARGARLAGVYALTMVLAYTAAGVLISILFGVTGVSDFAGHPVFNLVLGAVLVFFALNLLGLFEIRPPAFLVSGVNKLEMKFGRAAALGVGAQKKGGGIGDYLVVAIAALTATTVFFTCTVGFVGLVLVQAAQGEWVWPTVGMLSFSTAFALPFFFLAMFPQAAKRLQGKAGGWLSATRVTLGFLEMAAATKFLSNADLVWETEILTRDLVLSIWIPLFVLCGLFLIGKIRIGHEAVSSPDAGVSVPQVLSGAAMFTLSIYLAVGLFNARTFGGWIDGWLPPANQVAVARGGGGGAAAQPTLAWVHDLDEGRGLAKAQGKLVFVNYTGFNCTNCRYMEGGVFPRPEIASVLNTMVLVELYTDGRRDEHKRNRLSQVERFQTAALPHYSVERADGTVLGTFASSTNDPEEFRQFLLDSIAKNEAASPAASEPKLAKAGTDVCSGKVKLVAERLSDGAATCAIAPGKWTLVNLWATWCAPCKLELKDFMARVGNKFEARGQRFTVVAVEDADGLDAAKTFMQSIQVPTTSALRISDDYTEAEVDPKLAFDGSLPYTVLISPQGEVVWKHSAKLTEAELETVLIEHTGYAAK
jgi:thiol:disulfide interchange protein